MARRPSTEHSRNRGIFANNRRHNHRRPLPIIADSVGNLTNPTVMNGWCDPHQLHLTCDDESAALRQRRSALQCRGLAAAAAGIRTMHRTFATRGGSKVQVVRGVEPTTPSPRRENSSRLSNSFSEELQAVLSAGRRSDPDFEEMNRKSLNLFMNGEPGERPASSSSIARLAPFSGCRFLADWLHPAVALTQLCCLLR